MPTEITTVESPLQIAAVAELAGRIWTEHYTPIIGSEQVRYMLAELQSPPAIAEALRDGGARYFLIGAPPSGYLCYQQRGEVLFLSKIYVEQGSRGSGLGRRAFEFTCARGRELGCERLELTVNRGNAIAIAAYERWGMTRRGEKLVDIGGGFVMDDYVYELAL